MKAVDIIRERIAAAQGRMLPWHEVMRLALYEPGLGYYRQCVRRIGRSGDFYTSVSVGPLFGALLAEHCCNVWRSLSGPAEFVIIEQGAHDGTLAKDVLTALKTNQPELYARARYLIVEPDETFRDAQRRTLADEKLEHVAEWKEITQRTQGVFISNELLDAFPVHRVTLANGQWKEVFVRGDEDGGFEFVSDRATSEITRAMASMEQPFAEAHTTELNLDLVPWLRDIQNSGFEGEILIADYGHAAPEYFAPERREGTLRRYFEHQSDDKVLEGLGDCDLTAHVNFTQVAREAQALGWQVTEFIEQGRFLTHVASTMMSRPGFAPDAAWMRQFQTLTHPGHLGHSFQVMTLVKGKDQHLVSTNDQRTAALRRLGMADDPA